MQDDNVPTELDLDDLLAFAAQPDEAWDHPAAADDLVSVRRAVLRTAWDRTPEVVLAYDSVNDAVLIRFTNSPSIIEREIDRWISAGFDATGHDARLTTLCIVGLRSATLPAPVLTRARLLTGTAVWDAAIDLVTAGESRELRFQLSVANGAALRMTWEQAISTWEEVDAHEAVGPELTDREIERWMTDWTLEVAVHRDADTTVPTNEGLAIADSGEHEIPELTEFGIHPRITWQLAPEGRQELIVRAAPLSTDTQFATGLPGPVAVQIAGQALWTPLVGDEYGDLAASLPLPGEQMGLRIRIRHQPLGEEDS
ncbi:hypothetical protein [Nocardia sp. NPDC019255]|uniref:hypothetical protein n=1 Tax=Nocardia sp. NPDC019255 TaxID=3154591 RepID=UPI0033E8CB07